MRYLSEGQVTTVLDSSCEGEAEAAAFADGQWAGLLASRSLTMSCGSFQWIKYPSGLKGGHHWVLCVVFVDVRGI